MKARGFCIFIDTLFQGRVPSCYIDHCDGNGEKPEVFQPELEAQHEIVDNMQIRLRQFLDGEKDFDDAITVEEYVQEVEVGEDGSIVPV